MSILTTGKQEHNLDAELKYSMQAQYTFPARKDW